MLDSFEILTTSGVVLWSKSYAPVSANIVNSLIKEVFIEESVAPGGATSAVNDASAARNPTFKKERYTLKWTTAKDFGLIFVAVYQSLLHLSWIDRLLDNVKTLFTNLYGDQLKKPHSSVVECPFDDYFNRQVQELEKTSQEPTTTAPSSTSTQPSALTPPSSAEDEDGFDEPPPLPIPNMLKPLARTMRDDNTTSTEITPIPTPDSSRSASPAAHLVTAKSGPGSRTSRRGRKAATTTTPASRDLLAPTAKATGKKLRKWDANGYDDEDDGAVLDYSTQAGTQDSADPSNTSTPQPAISQESWSKRTGRGEVVLKDLDDEIDSILSSAAASKQSSNPSDADTSTATGLVNSGLNTISGLFRNVVGGKTLNTDDIAKALKGMQDHLIKKNVAQEAAVRLCDSICADLLGAKTNTWQSTDSKIRDSMEKALTHILTPTSSLDLLRAIQANVDRNARLDAAGRVASPPRRPYVISVVGVNGVGKSTTLAKLAFLFLHNNYRVLVVGGDTFRSGAVEQLRVHVRNLQSLIAAQGGRGANLGAIDLYERGYGKDPAHIARDAVTLASSHATPFDVVLIDTAGRRHNDTRLMSSLENFAKLASPDKIFMVGEALVGSDAVAQARHFNASFGPGRGLDGFIVSKCDTVGEMVGTIVSMVHATGVPVVAVGVGQHYGDLRTLNVGWATRLLMQ